MIKLICKECGGDVLEITLACYPPVYRKQCQSCGRIVSQEREKIIEKEV